MPLALTLSCCMGRFYAILNKLASVTAELYNALINQRRASSTISAIPASTVATSASGSAYGSSSSSSVSGYAYGSGSSASASSSASVSASGSGSSASASSSASGSASGSSSSSFPHFMTLLGSLPNQLFVNRPQKPNRNKLCVLVFDFNLVNPHTRISNGHRAAGTLDVSSLPESMQERISLPEGEDVGGRLLLLFNK